MGNSMITCGCMFIPIHRRAGDAAEAIHSPARHPQLAVLIYGTGIRIPAKSLKIKPRLRSNIRYSASPGIMLRPRQPLPHPARPGPAAPPHFLDAAHKSCYIILLCVSCVLACRRGAIPVDPESSTPALRGAVWMACRCRPLGMDDHGAPHTDISLRNARPKRLAWRMLNVHSLAAPLVCP